MLELNEFTIKLSKKTIVNQVTCRFQNGLHCVLGPNGAGKTTLIRGLLGLYRREDGMVRLDGEPFRACDVGYLPQQFGMFHNMTVREALTYFGNMKKIPGRQLKEEVLRCVEEVNLSDKINEKIEKLSGGMLRRVGIAQAIIGNPPILVFDEPAVGLDPEERLRMNQMLRKLRKDKILLVSTHMVEDAEYLSDYLEVMYQGRILFQGSCEEIKKLAENKVVELPMGDLPEDAYLVKEYEKEGQHVMRVLVKNQVKQGCLAPTVEDGYLCVLKGIS